MRYLTLDTIKQHLNLDAAFTADDTLLAVYGDAAERAIEKLIDTDLENIIAEEGDGDLPTPLLVAMLLVVGNLYLVRETISQVNYVTVPDTSRLLVDPYIDYSKKTFDTVCS